MKLKSHYFLVMTREMEDVLNAILALRCLIKDCRMY